MANKNQTKQEIHSKLYEDCLPKHWEVANFDEIAFATDYVANGSFASLKQNVSYKKEPDYAILVRLTDFHKGWNGNYVYVDKHAYTFLAKSSLEPGDIVISNVGDPGRVFQVPNLNQPMTLGPNSVLIKVYEGMEKSFISYFFMSPWGQDLISKIVTGTAQKKFNKTNLRQTFLPIAPENEQKRIVEEIEKQFSRLDEAVDNLKRVKANLKRYKASVLKAAVEGKLTEEWRKANPNVEPAEKLLERILDERRKKWEETELAKMKAKGKVPEDDKWKKKYKEPDAADKLNIELPKGWVIANVKQLSNLVQYGSSSKTNEDSDGITVFRMGNLFEGTLLLDKLKYLPKSHDEFPKLLLEPDDLLFNRTNSPELVGKTAVYKGKPYPCSFASYLIRVRFINGVDPNFICYFINSNYGRQWIKSVVSQQVGQANVNGTKLQALSVPLPPHNEQGIIVSEVENKFSIVDGIEKEIDKNLIRADRLRQSVLKKAFSGKLLQSKE